MPRAASRSSRREENGRSDVSVETSAGLLKANVDGADSITIDMGKPRFGWSDIPLAEPFEDTTGIELQIGPIDAPVLHTPLRWSTSATRTLIF